MKKLFIISGEKSGDLIANNVIKEARRQFPDVEIRGIGGESFSQNGLQSLFDQKEISIMGFFEILPKLKRMLHLFAITLKEIQSFKPDHIITIDSPGFNFYIAKKVQHSRVSRQEVKNLLQSCTIPKTREKPIKIVRLVQQAYTTAVLRIGSLTKKYRPLGAISKWSIIVFNFVKRILKPFHNKYTSGLFKIFEKFIRLFTHSHLVQAVLLFIFKEFVAVLVLIQGILLYLNTYRYLRYPYLIGKKIYEKITHTNEAKKNLSAYHQALILAKLEAKNTMYCNIISVIDSIPKLLKISPAIKLRNKILKLHRKFKQKAYSQAYDYKLHHVVAPSVWAYKKGRAKKVATLYDTLFCILPFEPPYFEKYGLKTVFIGYPPYFRTQEMLNSTSLPPYTILTSLKFGGVAHNETQSCQNSTQKVGLPILISVTLGSRISELKHHIPIIQKTITILNKRFPNQLVFQIISLPHLAGIIQKKFQKFDNTLILNEEAKWQKILQSRFVIAKSGTNVMEFAFLGKPSIVFYKTSFLTAFIIKMLLYTKTVTLLNIVAKRCILPEFIQKNTRNIHTKAIEWIENNAQLERTIQAMNKELKKFTSNEKPEEVILRTICN